MLIALLPVLDLLPSSFVCSLCLFWLVLPACFCMFCLRVFVRSRCLFVLPTLCLSYLLRRFVLSKSPSVEIFLYLHLKLTVVHGGLTFQLTS